MRKMYSYFFYAISAFLSAFALCGVSVFVSIYVCVYNINSRNRQMRTKPMAQHQAHLLRLIRLKSDF